MGGRIALEVYRQAPERVRRLALSSTGIHPLNATEPAKRRALQAIGHERGFDALVDAWLPPMVAEANRDTPAYAEMRHLASWAGKCVVRTSRAMPRHTTLGPPLAGLPH